MVLDRLRFILNRIRERLWVRPLIACGVSIAAIVLAKALDGTGLYSHVPEVSIESIETLLSIMSGGMLVIATFAVAAMVSAYASASNNVTPRSFRLVIADKVSQTALSAFVGAFIFSVVALTAVKNNTFGTGSRFAVFALTALVFAVVIFTFVRWVDGIARLGRLGSVIDRMEATTAEALDRRRNAPTLGGVPASSRETGGRAVHSPTVGYVQRIDIGALQKHAGKIGGRVTIAALPGTFATPERPLAFVRTDAGKDASFDEDEILDAFQIGNDRVFDEDPRFGLVVLSEIASRALSPGINDPGTAIAIIGALVRLFVRWSSPPDPDGKDRTPYDRVAVPELSVHDMFDDAFTGIARDGAGLVEVSIRLQKALGTLAAVGDSSMREAALHHAREALARAEEALDLPRDAARVRDSAPAHRVATFGERKGSTDG